MSADTERHDLHFFMGNTMSHPRNFMVVGLYYPPKVKPKQTARPAALNPQLKLF